MNRRFCFSLFISWSRFIRIRIIIIHFRTFFKVCGPCIFFIFCYTFVITFWLRTRSIFYIRILWLRTSCILFSYKRFKHFICIFLLFIQYRSQSFFFSCTYFWKQSFGNTIQNFRINLLNSFIKSNFFRWRHFRIFLLFHKAIANKFQSFLSRSFHQLFFICHFSF